MIRKIFILIAVVGLSCLWSSCAKEDEMGPSIFDTNPPPRTALDLWILQNLTIPYNINVDYRWKFIESDLTRNLTPPDEKMAEAFIKDILTKAWIEPYVDMAGIDFFNRSSPKQIYLVGSTAYNSTGTRTLGTASAGRKIVMYEINEYDKRNKYRIRQYMKTIHHEFTHIVNQTVDFDPEFELITPGAYRSDWNNATERWCRENGFISAYSSASPTEDFAEMTAIMLTTSISEWRAKIDLVPTAAEIADNLKTTIEKSRASLQRKEEIVVGYFKRVWNIDIYALQAKMEEAIEDIING